MDRHFLAPDNYISSSRDRSPVSDTASHSTYASTEPSMHPNICTESGLPLLLSDQCFVQSPTMQQNHFQPTSFHTLPSDASNFIPYQADTIHHVSEEDTGGLYFPYITQQGIESIPSLSTNDHTTPFDISASCLPINQWIQQPTYLYQTDYQNTTDASFHSLPEDQPTAFSTSPPSTIIHNSPITNYHYHHHNHHKQDHQQHHTQTQTTHQAPSPSPQPQPSPNISTYGHPNPDGTWRCAYPGCTSQTTFRRACDLRKHFTRHRKHLFCRHVGCPQASRGGFSSSKDRARHEAKHNPGVLCEWDGCGRIFSRVDNMKDHVRRIHKRASA
ncbi:hypothetical protein ASPWEDRAFT_25561 [Aspergillus wentii DTO 134E9]|uniref:C2H2-type domain-containing protein n=1 Tax=Aspergillus wentii DTO 134E9 TaxID=1073089 RepID=A0A1L9RXT8_ASPWE|nr:uncharacterized protein ASPWEDRAFT_25561 [Aspergillus wentii DTO 134E9]KAI9931568.1 hypothetical protein MW887_010145 [Aspergillus wentii]OJJ39761.1 hypothetical protein ASPWEDRAFT_25561 [Aspergillus wentii DTO 134E9]